MVADSDYRPYFVRIYIYIYIYIYICIKPREHGDCMFRNGYTVQLQALACPGTLGTGTRSLPVPLPWDSDVK